MIEYTFYHLAAGDNPPLQPHSCTWTACKKNLFTHVVNVKCLSKVNSVLDAVINNHKMRSSHFHSCEFHFRFYFGFSLVRNISVGFALRCSISEFDFCRIYSILINILKNKKNSKMKGEINLYTIDL